MASDFTCKQCSTCDPGWGIWRSCRGARNTVCRKCPPGTFSGVQTGTLGCILCTKCNSDEVMLEECSGVHDSICIDKRKLKYSLNAIKDDDFIENTGNSLYIYFGLLIAIVLVLFVYIIFQLRFKTIVKTESNFNSQQTFKYPVNYHNNYNKEVHSQRQRQYNYIPVL
ncbi:tumor necrosis factor receptor superfamily member 5-like [Oppia nitens]|uniref:tumor necrosis factor receptor superfamily member 5-like n=1 Tax=Oppia nitens TaxID=1686743 RepID=UPI0023DB036A|nr:tumor necrosis factor receptor superfamily member 5-like [Oppia nitens]